MRRIVSLVWNDIRTTQNSGNRKNSTTSSNRAPRRIRPGRALPLISGAPAAGALAQAQPVLDELHRDQVGDQPQHHQHGGGAPDVEVLEEVEIGLDLEQ